MVFNVTSTYTPGDAFSIGSTEVMYWVEAEDGDILASCSFNVHVVGKVNMLALHSYTNYTIWNPM